MDVEDRIADVLLSNCDKVTALRAFMAFRRVKRLRELLLKVRDEWDEHLVQYVRLIISLLERQADEGLRRVAARLRTVSDICEALRRSDI